MIHCFTSLPPAVLLVLVHPDARGCLAPLSRGGEFNRKYANKIMRARIAAQAVAVLLLILLFVFTCAGMGG